MPTGVDGSGPAGVHRWGELGRTERTWAVVVLGGSFAVSVALVLHLARNGWTQVGDEANQIFDSRRAFDAWPLLGDFNTSNYYGNPASHHPGPMAYYLLAPFVLVLGSALGAWVFAVAWNFGWVALTGVFVFRVGGARLSALGIVLGFVAAGSALDGRLASTFFQDLPLTPLLFCLIGSWVLARGDTLVLPFIVFAASFVVQAATLNLPLVVLALGAGATAAMVRLRREQRPERWIAHGASALLVLVVLWAPAVWDQLFGSRNLSALLSARIPHAGVAGLLPAIEVLPGRASFLWLAAIALVALIARGRPQLRPDLPSVGLVVAVVVGAAINAMLLPADDVEETHLHWVPIAGAVILFGICTCIRPGPNRVRVARSVVAIVGVCAIALALSETAVPERWDGKTNSMAATQRFTAAAADLDLDHNQQLLLSFRGSGNGIQVAQGLSPLLDEHGMDVERVFTDFSSYPGQHFLVATLGEQTPWQTGEVTDVHQPVTDWRDDGDAARRLHSFATAADEFRLRPHAAGQLDAVLDGLLPAYCLPSLVDHPEEFLDFDPEIVARLFALGLVASPVLDPELATEAQQWISHQPLTLISIPSAQPRSDSRLWSGDSC